MTEPRKIRVMIADDFKTLCDVIRLYLERADDMTVIAEAPHLDEALAEAKSLNPDVILMNDYLPPVDSAIAAGLVRQDGITARIIVISMDAEAALIHRSFASGVDGFIRKDEIDQFLVQAIRMVHGGERYLSPQAREAYDGLQE